MSTNKAEFTDDHVSLDGGNEGSLIGNSTFNKHFEISLSEGMPSGGNTWDTTLIINSK